ncbi:hypothetical protein HELRODRAFT_178409 [Helobdella robusta]|uniref:CARD domain-containing protein n=1 Tax=Helobdella robusta TaxID=6412 RepID=T1FD47_HELRO|nr:hypothetical protein HELRODRAFT_178409 [Helobdella robusta]ESN97281.1 hypothetical protein HELRODRAFT_178409 [Helobdella robusta]
MDDRQDWQEFLTESYHSLARVIRPQCFYTYLRSKNVFNLCDQEYVENTYVTTVMKAGCLIDTIMTKGEPGFKAFMEIVEYKYPELFQTVTGRSPRLPPRDTQEPLQQARNVDSSLLSPDLTLIILHIALRNSRVLGSIGPRTSIHIGKNSIEGRAFPYFFIFSSAALAAAKPHSLLVRFTYRSARVPGTVTSHAKHLPALQGISVHPSGRLPSCAEMPDGSLRTGIEALEKSRQMAVRRAPSNSPNLEGSMCLDVRRKYINLGKLRALRIIVKASWAERQETRPRANLSSEYFAPEWRTRITSVTDSLGLLMKCLGPLQESLMEKREAFRELETRILTLKEENEECSQQFLAQIELLKQQIDNINIEKEILEKDLTSCRQSEQNYKKLYEDMRAQRDREQERSIQLRERCDVMGSKVNNLSVEIETERQRSMKRRTTTPNDLDDGDCNDDRSYIGAFKKVEEDLKREREKNKKLKEECQGYMKKYKEVIERVENLEKEMEEQVEKQNSESPEQKIIRNKYSKKECLPRILDREIPNQSKSEQTTNASGNSRNDVKRFATIGASPLVVFAPRDVEKELRNILANSIKPYPIEVIRSEEEMNMCAYHSDILYSTPLGNDGGYCCIRYSSLFEMKETYLVTVPCECVFRMIKNNIIPIICLVKFYDMAGFSELNREEERFEKENIKYLSLKLGGSDWEDGVWWR